MRAIPFSFRPPQSLPAFAKSALAACRLDMPLFIMLGSSTLPDCISWGVDSGLTPSALRAWSIDAMPFTRYPPHLSPAFSR